MGTIKKSSGFYFANKLGFNDNNYPPSVANLNPALTINGQTKYPTLRYKGGDAGAVSWAPWGYGETLTLQAGTAPTFNNGSPLLGSLDDSVKFNGGGYYQAGNNTFADITTEDIVIEFIWEEPAGVTDGLLGKLGEAPLQGYYFGMNSGKIAWVIYLNNLPIVVNTAAIPAGTINHGLLFADRSGSAQWYINGAASGSAVSIAASAASITTANSPLMIGKLGTASTYMFFCASMWKQSNWLDTHLQATVAQTRFAQLTGVYPQSARGTYLPTAVTRSSAGYLDKVESDGTTKLYYVGSNWPRVCSRKDSSGVTRKGYLSETSAQNLVLQSHTFATTWTIGGATVPTTSVVCPDGITRTTNTLHEDGSSGATHYMIQSLSAPLSTSTKYVYSLFVKAANRTRCTLYWINQSTTIAYSIHINLAAGTYTTGEGSPIAHGLESVGNGWYRAYVAFTTAGTVSISSARLFAVNDAGSATFDGLNQDSVYIFGAQCELGNYPSSYIPTTTAAVTRSADLPERYSGSANFGVSQGSLQFKFLSPVYTPSVSIYLFTCYKAGSSTTDYITFYLDTSGYINVASAATAGNAGACQKATNFCDGSVHTVTCSWIKNNLRLWVDGLAATADTSCDFATDMDTIDIGADKTPSANNAGPVLVGDIYMNPISNRWG